MGGRSSAAEFAQDGGTLKDGPRVLINTHTNWRIFYNQEAHRPAAETRIGPFPREQWNVFDSEPAWDSDSSDSRKQTRRG
jgi:hypothetical protein